MQRNIGTKLFRPHATFQARLVKKKSYKDFECVVEFCQVFSEPDSFEALNQGYEFSGLQYWPFMVYLDIHSMLRVF